MNDLRTDARLSLVAKRRRASIVLCCLLALGVLRVSPAQASRSSHSADEAVKYLQQDQNIDGGFGGEPGAASNPDFTAWVSLALAAAGVNPRDQKKPGGVDAYTYLVEHTGELTLTTDFERELLVVDAAGTSPHDFGGVDLVAKILERELQEPGEEGVAFPHEAGSSRAGMNDTIFAVIALSPIHEPDVETAVQQASTWIEHEQNLNGSWPAICPKTVPGCSPFGKEPEGETDMTAAAIEALNAAGRHGTPAQEKGLHYLHETQNPAEGGFAEQLGTLKSNAESTIEANVGSTAWATQAIWAAGQNPEEWNPDGADPLTYMESMQQPDGHVRWMRSRELNGVWMTAYAGPALFGDPLPIPAVPYTEPPVEPTAPGSGGEGAQSGSGVDAGGGGEGAPLFSRPQPQSTGHTPGGIRVLASHSARKPRSNARRRKRNPGRPRRQPAPTQTAAAQATAHAAQRANHGEPSGSGGPHKGVVLPTPSTGGSPPSAGREVSGVLIGSPVLNKRADEPGAPGLRGAGAKQASSLPAIAIGVAMLVLALCGSAVERHRPRPIP